MQKSPIKFAPLAVAALLGSLSLAAAHGHGQESSPAMEMGMLSETRPIVPATNSSVTSPESYFQYGEHSTLIFCHIMLMSISWIFVLPIGVMLSIARSRYCLSVQLLFLALNGIGVFLVTVYNASTPDLYPNNAHHKLGWILTGIVGAQFIMGAIGAYTMRHDAKLNDDRAGFIPISTEAIAEHHGLHNSRIPDISRFSNDSGQGTERNTESLRSHSISSARDEDLHLPQSSHQGELEDREEKYGLIQNSRLDRFLSKRLPGLISKRPLRVLRFVYNAIDRLILILGFLAISTGVVTYGGLFKGSRIFSGLAHFIKGGVFFWYGILTLGRWAGCFADLGWSWNVKPTMSKYPSAEFTESFLIFFYGSTNVFLEHLAAWGSEWTAEDFEHISITIMFIGGGLCGMLIESEKVRDLMNATILSTPTHSHVDYHSGGKDALAPPRTYGFSMNPIPALVVLLLGMMMSSHHQETMFATMIHKQWGSLLVGAAFSRAATYVIFYLAPPTSILPGRPPSELITAFCLMAGGMVFMASARDSVMSMEAYNPNSMFVFTVTIGFITFLMAWIILVIAIKGWAVRKEIGSFTYRTMA